MKAILKFQLPEENHEYNMANKASDYYSALFDIFSELRREYKYGEHSVVRLERVYDRFFQILEENEVTL